MTELEDKIKTQKSLTSMWSITGVTTLYIVANIAFEVHGSEFFLPSIKLEDVDHYSASFYGIFFTLPLIFSVHYLTRIYSNHFGEKDWWLRIPVAFNREIYELPNFLRTHQIFIFILFLAIPSLLHIDFVNKFFNGTVYIESTCEGILVGIEHFTLEFNLYTEYGINGFRYGDVDKGIDYYPIIFPIAIVLIEIAHLYSIWLTLSCVFKNSANK